MLHLKSFVLNFNHFLSNQRSFFGMVRNPKYRYITTVAAILAISAVAGCYCIEVLFMLFLDLQWTEKG